MLKKYDGFSEFVTEWLYPNRYQWGVPHFYPQVHFLKMDSEIPLDFIGCIEKIENDFKKISKRLGKMYDLKKRNETMAKKKPMKEYYKKESVLKRVKRVYKEDFDRLGYSRKVEKAKEVPNIKKNYR